jgi:pre-60S factor REI1
MQTLQSHIKSTEHLIRKEQRILERGSQAGSMVSTMTLGSAAMGLHRRHKAHQKLRQQMREDHADPAAKQMRLRQAEDDEEEGVTTAEAGAAPQPQTHRPSAEDREADITVARCLLCGYKSKSLRGNLHHMLHAHDFTIPLQEQCHDLTGLVEYLGRKINGCVCLVCGEATKKYDTLEALRAHMKSANHERIVLSSEYQEFYTCRLDDGEAAKVERVPDAMGQLVIKAPTGATIGKRDADGLIRHIRESATETMERRLLTQQRMEENQVILRERLELAAPAQKAQLKMAQAANRHHQQHMMTLSIRANKLHPKGYDGEGEVN